MSRGVFASAGALASSIAIISLAPVLVVGQTAPIARTPVKAAKWTPPRTPWGDPDLQGAFSNSDERGIPMSRPDALKHFPLRHFPPAELARLNRQRALQFHPEKNQWRKFTNQLRSITAGRGS